MIETAMRYRELGYRPIPLVAGEKRAAIKWKEFQAVPPTEEQIIEWFSGAERDIALVTGNGVVVVDIDDPGLLPTVLKHRGMTLMRCRTPSGGMHLYYGMRPGIHYGNAIRINGKPVDLRCEGAYAVCPWSQSGNGVPYRMAARTGPGCLAAAGEDFLAAREEIQATGDAR